MDLLYIGLTNNIREVAERLATASKTFGFVKPGDVRARAAHDAMKRHHTEFIVIAEALGTPDYGIWRPSEIVGTVKSLRDLGIDQPIIGLTQPYNEKRIADFLAVGGTLALPLKPLSQQFYTVSSKILLPQIDSIRRLVGVLAPPEDQKKLLSMMPLAKSL